MKVFSPRASDSLMSLQTSQNYCSSLGAWALSQPFSEDAGRRKVPASQGCCGVTFWCPPQKTAKHLAYVQISRKCLAKLPGIFFFFFRSAQDVLQPLWARIDAGFWHVVCWRLQAVAEASGVQLAFKPGFIGRKLSGPAGGRHDLVTLSGNRAGLVWSKGEYFQGNMRFLGVFQSQGKSKNFQSNCLAFPG